MTKEFSDKINKAVEQVFDILDEFEKFKGEDPDTSRRVMLTKRVLNACIRQLILFGGMSCMRQVMRLETREEKNK